MGEIHVHDRPVRIKADAAYEIGCRVVRIMADARAARAGHLTDPGNRAVTIGKQVGIKPFGLRVALDLAAGLFARVITHAAHGMRQVQRLATPRKRQPGFGLDTAGGIVDQEKPLVFAGVANARFDPVIEPVHQFRAVETEILEIDIHDLEIVKKPDTAVKLITHLGRVRAVRDITHLPLLQRLRANLGETLSQGPRIPSICHAVAAGPASQRT